jgi:hypothetical protein
MPFTASHTGDFSSLHQSRWSRRFWADLAERTVTAAGSGVVSGSARQWWVIVGLPAALSVVKGIVANAKDSESGASLLPAPPGPEVNPDEGYEGRHVGEH